jgi:hypothetical protein
MRKRNGISSVGLVLGIPVLFAVIGSGTCAALVVRNIREQEKARSEKVAVEASWTPEDRAQLAVHQLNVSANEESVCAARKLLNPIAQADRKKPDVVKAYARLHNRETEVLTKMRADADEYRTVICRDGSASDCKCKGSRRGCCSSHGGVASCEPLPNEIICP